MNNSKHRHCGNAGYRRTGKPALELAASILVASLLPCGSAIAQSNPGDGDAGSNATRFSGTYWSQIYPKRDYDRGCAIGFLAFEFQPAGYFIFDRKVTGSWQVDELGNLKLRTKQGEVLKLVVHSDTLEATSELGLVKRAYLYQKCPT
jgi:hypothetical protein